MTNEQIRLIECAIRALDQHEVNVFGATGNVDFMNEVNNIRSTLRGVLTAERVCNYCHARHIPIYLGGNCNAPHKEWAGGGQ